MQAFSGTIVKSSEGPAAVQDTKLLAPMVLRQPPLLSEQEMADWSRRLATEVSLRMGGPVMGDDWVNFTAATSVMKELVYTRIHLDKCDAQLQQLQKEVKA